MHVVVGVMALVATVVIVCMRDMVHWWSMQEGGEGVVGMRGWRWSGHGRTCHHCLAPSCACGAVVVVNSLSALSCSSSRCVHVIVVMRVKVVVVLVIAVRAWCGGGQCERKVVEKWWSNHELRCGACRASCGRCRVSVCTKVIDRGIRVTIIASKCIRKWPPSIILLYSTLCHFLLLYVTLYAPN